MLHKDHAPKMSSLVYRASCVWKQIHCVTYTMIAMTTAMKHILLAVSQMPPVVMFLIISYILIITLLDSAFQCDFEQSMCGFTNDENNDDFDWTLARGSTSSSQTGPETDHTTGDSNG